MSDLREDLHAWVKDPAQVTDMKPRTNAQNASLYKWERMLAEALNDGGIPFGEVVLKLPREYTQQNIHALIIHPLMQALYPNKTSTAQLSTTEIQDLYLRADKIISERTTVTIPWPSNEAPLTGE